MNSAPSCHLEFLQHLLDQVSCIDSSQASAQINHVFHDETKILSQKNSTQKNYNELDITSTGN